MSRIPIGITQDGDRCTVCSMGAPEDHQWGPRTRAIHAGGRPDPETGARQVPIYQTTSFVFEDVADAADLFALQKYGNVYSRLGNPTVAAFEERCASLEGGIGAVATASGQAAATLLLTSLAGAGDHVVASSELYGGTYVLLNVTLRRLGIETTFVPAGDPAAFAAAIEPGRTKLLYTETVSNPAGTVADLEALGEIAHAAGIPLAVDATLTTPHLCRPLEHGADVVVHSATKFLGGHGTSLGGVVIDSGRFPWDNGNFPLMTEPVATYGNLRFWDNFGEYGFCTKLRVEGLRTLGGVLAPMNAFLLLHGMETLALRMNQHVANARAVAEHLAADERVGWVRYAGLPGDPSHALAQRYMPAGAGAVLSFGLRGGRAAGEAFIEGVELCSHLANVGDTRTLVIHPASTTHRQLSEEALEAAGVLPDLVRISVGIEDLEDILYDLDAGLAAAEAAAARAEVGG
jgi:O-acetylhomoserine (thiol)-lyase